MSAATSAPAEKRERKDDVFLLPVHAKNVALFKKVLDVVLPVAYDEHFYEQSSTGAWAEFSRILYYKDVAVGVAGARLEGDPARGARRLYVTVLAVLAAYRGRGLGARLLAELTDAAAARGDVAEVYAHVHVGSEARAFYARAGFAPDAEPVVGYYAVHRHVKPPPDALIFRKAVRPAAGAGEGAAAGAAAGAEGAVDAAGAGAAGATGVAPGGAAGGSGAAAPSVDANVDGAAATDSRAAVAQ